MFLEDLQVTGEGRFRPCDRRRTYQFSCLYFLTTQALIQVLYVIFSNDSYSLIPTYLLCFPHTGQLLASDGSRCFYGSWMFSKASPWSLGSKQRKVPPWWLQHIWASKWDACLDEPYDVVTSSRGNVDSLGLKLSRLLIFVNYKQGLAYRKYVVQRDYGYMFERVLFISCCSLPSRLVNLA